MNSSPEKIRLRLRRVDHADFRRNDASQFGGYAATLRLTGNDCVLLVSKNEKVMRFLFSPRTVESGVILSSRTYRICGQGTWSDLMIQNYAEAVGIELEGIKLFQQHFAEMQMKKKKMKKATKRNEAKIIPLRPRKKKAA